MAFYYNQSNCIGCKACQTACKDVNDLPVGILFRHVRDFETGKFPNVGKYHFAETCNHCSTPACVAACTTGSFYMDMDDGTIQQDTSLCNGCKACIEACHYEIPQYWEVYHKAVKCNACIELRGIGEPPACVAACTMRILEFGDMDKLIAKHSEEMLVKDLPFLPDSSRTAPNTVFKARPCSLEKEYREHMYV